MCGWVLDWLVCRKGKTWWWFLSFAWIRLWLWSSFFKVLQHCWSIHSPETVCVAYRHSPVLQRLYVQYTDTVQCCRDYVRHTDAVQCCRDWMFSILTQSNAAETMCGIQMQSNAAETVCVAYTVQCCRDCMCGIQMQSNAAETVCAAYRCSPVLQRLYVRHVHVL